MDDDVIVTLTMDDGSEEDFNIICIFEAEGQEYIALQPVDDEEADVLLYRYYEDEEGEPSLDVIEDDDEYDIAADAFDEWLDNLEYDELFNGEE